MLRSSRLLIIAVVVYNLMVYGAPAVTGANPDGINELLSRHLALPVFSGQLWNFSVGDAIVLFALCLLFVEVVNATRTTAMEIIGLTFDLVIFMITLVQFVLLKGFATSPYFVILVTTLFSVVSGFTKSIVITKRDIGMSRGIIGTG